MFYLLFETGLLFVQPYTIWPRGGGHSHFAAVLALFRLSVSTETWAAFPRADSASLLFICEYL